MFFKLLVLSHCLQSTLIKSKAKEPNVADSNVGKLDQVFLVYFRVAIQKLCQPIITPTLNSLYPSNVYMP